MAIGVLDQSSGTWGRAAMVPCDKDVEVEPKGQLVEVEGSARRMGMQRRRKEVDDRGLWIATCDTFVPL